ncbi:hypothetical protein [Halospeciosus flavus]|uniref:Uncharacterized protein n=1 Tax=Halospeciosus flavus TaxID=3032283 RepID=A0ABD5Z2Z2_9EURY|nr:hypothetical protein [Halospeciosus flavus]
MSIETQTQSDSSIETETIDNPERGCGYLKSGKAYLRSDVGPGGDLPAFVEFAEPVPFKENRKRSYKEFPGLQFELAVTGPGGMTETVPEGEASRHVERLLADRPTGTHAGEMVEFESHDLLLSVGKSHYRAVEEFVDEARVHGVSKAISVTSGNAPPEINPGRTRLFLIHPNAVRTTKEVETTFSEYDPETDTLLTVNGEPVENEPVVTETADPDLPVTLERRLRTAGIFGYTYLTRVVYTEDEDGEIPKYVQDYEATGDLDVVKPGKPEPYSEQEAFNDDGELKEEYDDALDAEAIVEGLEAAEDEVREFAETFTPDGEGAFLRGDLDAGKDEQEPATVPDFDVTEMERADFGDLAGQGWVEAESPLMAHDALSGADDGALAVVHGESGPEAVFPSNNLNVTEKGGYTQGVSVVGPYRVEARLLNTGGRRVKVEQTR